MVENLKRSAPHEKSMTPSNGDTADAETRSTKTSPKGAANATLLRGMDPTVLSSRPLCTTPGCRRHGKPMENKDCRHGHQRYRCTGCGVSLTPEKDPPSSPDRRPPPCPIPGCGKERHWDGWASNGKRRATCPEGHNRVLNSAEMKALQEGDPFPERKTWEDIQLAKART